MSNNEEFSFLKALDHIFINRKCADLFAFLGVIINGVLCFWFALMALQSELNSGVSGVLALICVV